MMAQQQFINWCMVLKYRNIDAYIVTDLSKKIKFNKYSKQSICKVYFS